MGGRGEVGCVVGWEVVENEVCILGVMDRRWGGG